MYSGIIDFFKEEDAYLHNALLSQLWMMDKEFLGTFLTTYFSFIQTNA